MAALANLRAEFVVLCLAVCAATSALAFDWLSSALLAAVWGGIGGYLLKAGVEVVEGRGPS